MKNKVIGAILFAAGAAFGWLATIAYYTVDQAPPNGYALAASRRKES